MFRGPDSTFDEMLAALEPQPIGQPAVTGAGTGIWFPLSLGWLCAFAPGSQLRQATIEPLPEELNIP